MRGAVEIDLTAALQDLKKTVTQNSAIIFGLGSKITKADAILTGCCLPTSLQVLHCTMYPLNDGGSMNQTR